MGKKIDVDDFNKHMTNLSKMASNEGDDKLALTFKMMIEMMNTYAKVFGED